MILCCRILDFNLDDTVDQINENSWDYGQAIYEWV